MSDRNEAGISVAGYITLLVVIVYLGLEVFGLHKARDRMEPAFVFNEFLGARRAASLCGVGEGQGQAFEQNFTVVTRRALEALRESVTEAQTSTSDEQLAETLSTQRQAREREVDALVAAEGCDGEHVWRLLKLHEIRSRLSLR